MSDLLLHNAGELATLAGGVRRGRAAMNDLRVIKDGAVAIRDGRIVAVGRSRDLLRDHHDLPRFDAEGRSVVPGFVDPHTHPVFAGDRAHEFEMRLQGKTYQEILKAGGGILYTVRKTREASKEQLLAQLLTRLDRMLLHGTTTVEAKTGYGLDLDTELRLLDVLREARHHHPVEVAPTFMPAHAVPPEFKDAASFAEHVAHTITPKAAGRGAEFVDVFCEEGVFTPEESRLVLEAGRRVGMKVKVHADELAHSGGSQLAAGMRAVSADHLLHADAADARALAEAGTVAVLLPGTAFTLRAPYANAQALMDAGCAVALATDFNPNCFCESMPFMMALAAQGMRMTPAESLAASTINAAAAVDRAATHGSIEVGKVGDLVVLDAPSHVHLPYHFGVNVVQAVVKGGRLVVDRGARRA
ncbi:MAG TPA: imidazolonepropionase [Candidatus Thermoplasmatota archaeon]|nr:imidazolonepropionase [Candidatus Thermoplasmatota archaeon]